MWVKRDEVLTVRFKGRKCDKKNEDLIKGKKMIFNICIRDALLSDVHYSDTSYIVFLLAELYNKKTCSYVLMISPQDKCGRILI